MREEKLSNPSPHTYIKRPKSKHRKKSQWVRKDSWAGRIIIFGVIMFTISKGFAVISATKNLHLPFIRYISASGRTRFLEWVVLEKQKNEKKIRETKRKGEEERGSEKLLLLLSEDVGVAEPR
ncbi:hypothetical protein Prudu_939S000100 [Prunus dulcis]|uniref:Transmembrane protein n=1 Tax=Prunus dulcis TaxID=3755 RepID=A0A5H2XN07_PRUDU|nr:hypothetical protein Prudu_939S000100 [Prunus dulcis]